MKSPAVLDRIPGSKADRLKKLVLPVMDSGIWRKPEMTTEKNRVPIPIDLGIGSKADRLKKTPEMSGGWQGVGNPPRLKNPYADIVRHVSEIAKLPRHRVGSQKLDLMAGFLESSLLNDIGGDTR